VLNDPVDVVDVAPPVPLPDVMTDLSHPTTQHASNAPKQTLEGSFMRSMLPLWRGAHGTRDALYRDCHSEKEEANASLPLRRGLRAHARGASPLSQ
jgi:hypothetical protein